MTMQDHKCEICHINKPMGVACTVLPYSCAYCVECARRFAQPMIVFETFFMDVGTDLELLADPSFADMETFHDGKYISYREWSKWRAGQLSEDV